MKHNILSSVLLTSTLLFALTAQAQSANYQQYHQNNTYQVRHYQAPKPITEEVLKKRLDAQLTMAKKQMAFDKQQADVYAANFARFQKQQANALHKMMAQAEKQRQFNIKRLEFQQQNIVAQFAKYQVAKDSKK